MSTPRQACKFPRRQHLCPFAFLSAFSTLKLVKTLKTFKTAPYHVSASLKTTSSKSHHLCTSTHKSATPVSHGLSHPHALYPQQLQPGPGLQHAAQEWPQQQEAQAAGEGLCACGITCCSGFLLADLRCYLLQMDRFIPARNALDMDVASFNLLKENATTAAAPSPAKVLPAPATDIHAPAYQCMTASFDLWCSMQCFTLHRPSTRSGWRRALARRPPTRESSPSRTRWLLLLILCVCKTCCSHARPLSFAREQLRQPISCCCAGPSATGGAPEPPGIPVHAERRATAREEDLPGCPAGAGADPGCPGPDGRLLSESAGLEQQQHGTDPVGASHSTFNGLFWSRPGHNHWTSLKIACLGRWLQVAVALRGAVYLWNAGNGSIEQVLQTRTPAPACHASCSEPRTIIADTPHNNIASSWPLSVLIHP